MLATAKKAKKAVELPFKHPTNGLNYLGQTRFLPLPRLAVGGLSFEVKLSLTN